jgi:hypothetical protein
MSEQLDMAKEMYLERCSGVPGAPGWDELSPFTRNEYVRVATNDAALTLVGDVERWLACVT